MLGIGDCAFLGHSPDSIASLSTFCYAISFMGKHTAIIVAAGQSSRMGADTDKLLLNIAGRPVVAHTWARYDRADCIDAIVLVIRADRQALFEKMAADLKVTKPYRLVDGGKERQDSVKAGIDAVDDDTELVAIADGARPCTSETLIRETLEAAESVGAAVAAQRVTDTVKESHDGRMVSRHLDRSRLWAVQTPQCFKVDVIRRAMEAVREQRQQVTDDTAACRLIGQPVQLVEGLQPNPKVTRPEDLDYIEILLKARNTD